MKKTVISLAVVIVFITGLYYLSARQTGDGETAIGQAGVLTSEETSFDFGTISMARGKVSHNYKLKNNSDQTVEVNKLYTSCMCTEASLLVDGKNFGPFGMPGHGFSQSLKQKITPGEEISIEAVFDPAAHGPAGVGAISRIITIEEKSGAQTDLVFSAVVVP